MSLFKFLLRRFTHLLEVAAIAVLVLVAVGLWRLHGYTQSDDQSRLANKIDYLRTVSAAADPGADRPNIVFILYDDLGYGDLGHGSDNTIKTPNFDRLAAQGVMLTDFHSPAPVCTPSRTGYLTGRLAPRAGLPNVVFPTDSAKDRLFRVIGGGQSNRRLPAEEVTLADILRAAGYATGMVGKWHLGDRKPSLPNDMGFDSYYGALYSNDMFPFAFYRDTEIAVDAPADQTRMTELYTAEARHFIENHANQPFFLYFAHNFPHDPLAVRDSRAGQSDAGLFGDVIEEIDEGMGRLIATLEATGNLENTLIIISSDNGPWFLGDAGDQRGRKGNTFEGGMRVPFIAHWPAALPGGRVEHAMAMGTDLVPTVLDLLDLPGPTDRTLDGRSILGVLRNGDATPHDYLYYYDSDKLFAVRDQRFKYRGAAGVLYSTDAMAIGGAVPQKEWLFDLREDAREAYDTSLRHPQALARLRAAFEAKQKDMAENLRGWR